MTCPPDGLHTDLPRLRAGGVGAQFWSVYVPCDVAGHAAVTATLEQIDLVHRLVARHPDDLALATTADEVEKARGEGRIASLLGAEGGHCIDDSLGALRAFYRLGVRYLTLTHNRNTPGPTAPTDEPVHGGLTDVRPRGRPGDEPARHARRPVARRAGHHARRAGRLRPRRRSSRTPRPARCCDHPRNVPDDVLRRVAATRTAW